MYIRKHSTAWYKQQTAKINREKEQAINTFCNARLVIINARLERLMRKPYL